MKQQEAEGREMQKMTLGEFRMHYLRPDDLVKVMRGKTLAYAGNVFTTPGSFEKHRVEEICIDTEVRRKGWETVGIWEPLRPEAAAVLNLADAEIRHYWKIIVAEEE